MTSGRAPEPEFASFLALFHPDPLQAESEYRRLRHKLICFFQQRFRADVDSLADEVIVRAVDKWREGKLVETPARYCYGIARNLLKEKVSASVPIESAEDLKAPEVDPLRVVLLRELLDRLPPTDRALIVAYYMEDRQALARALGLSENALRIRAHRVTETLRAVASISRGNPRDESKLK